MGCVKVRVVQIVLGELFPNVRPQGRGFTGSGGFGFASNVHSCWYGGSWGCGTASRLDQVPCRFVRCPRLASVFVDGSAYGFIIRVVVSSVQFSTRHTQQSLCSGEFSFSVDYEGGVDVRLFSQYGDVSREGSLKRSQG